MPKDQKSRSGGPFIEDDTTRLNEKKVSGGGRQHGKGVAGVPKLYGIRMYVLSESLVDMYHMTTLCTVPSTLTFTLGQAGFR